MCPWMTRNKSQPGRNPSIWASLYPAMAGNGIKKDEGGGMKADPFIRPPSSFILYLGRA